MKIRPIWKLYVYYNNHTKNSDATKIYQLYI